MELREEDIREIVTMVWESMLDGGLNPSQPSETSWMDEGIVRSAVEIRGAWNGLLVLDLERGFAERLAGSWLPGEDEEDCDGLLTDAAGELANILGGNIKALLPQASMLGLPESGALAHAKAAVDGTTVLSRHCFEWSGTHFALTILEI